MNRLCLALLLTVATAAVFSNGESEVPAVLRAAEPGDCELDENGCLTETVPESRANLNLGAPGANDRMLVYITHRVAASEFLIQDQDITYRGPEYTNITGIWVHRIATTQNARPTVIAGGLGYDFVTIRILGARGRGFDYYIRLDAAINCSNS